MNMSYRHRSVMVLMIAAVSVFLCSCGIPTYWEPANNSSNPIISKLSAKDDGEIKFKVNIQYHPEYSGENAPKIGLLLLYTYSKTQHSAVDTELVKEFNSTYRGSTTANGLSPLTAKNGNAVWEFTVDETRYGVYAFAVPTREEVSAYAYNLDITSTTDIDKEYTLKLAENVTDGVLLYEKKTLTPIAKYDFGQESSILTELLASNIHVYVAISAQGNGYSNLYWSNLVYVGSFELDTKSKESTFVNQSN